MSNIRTEVCQYCGKISSAPCVTPKQSATCVRNNNVKATGGSTSQQANVSCLTTVDSPKDKP